MKKIVILDSACAKQNDLTFADIYKLGEVSEYIRTTPSQVVERIADSEIVITNKVPITTEIIDACPNIKYISVLATGYNIIDTSYAKNKGILVSNVPAYSAYSVVQHTIALLLYFTNKVAEHNEAVKKHEWSQYPDFCLYKDTMLELHKKTIGIIGYGDIGKKVAKVSENLGLNVIFNTRSKKEGSVSLDEIYQKSDIISLHCPLTDETYHMINQYAIQNMKHGVIIINTSRGGLIDEYAVNNALNCGQIAYYAADVLTDEPPKQDNVLISNPKTVITSHVAWATREARFRLIKQTYENVKSYIAGTPINVINK